jgi:rhomboid protease GluP
MDGAPPPPSPERERLGSRIRRSPATAALIGAFIAVFLAELLDTDRRLIAAFAKIGERVRAGEVWRLFTASFLHGGVVHLWLNAASLASVGPPVERAYGWRRYLVLFLVGGACGMALSVVLVPQPSLGASAGVFAVLGALAAYALRARNLLPRAARGFIIRQVLVVVGLNLGIGLMVRVIDNAAHVGGLVGGFLLGLVLRPEGSLFEPPPSRRGPEPR